MAFSKSPNNQSATAFSRSTNDYWINKFAGIEELQLPKDPLKSPSKRKDENALSFLLKKELLESISNNFKDNTAPPAIILFGVLKVLLYRYGSQDDFCIGATIKKSNLFHSTGENINDDYLNILPIRTKIDGRRQFGEFIRTLEEDFAEAKSHSHITVDQLISYLGKKDKKDLRILFPVVFDYQENVELDVSSQLSRIDLENFNSVLWFGFVEHADKIEATITFDTEFYCLESIKRMSSHFLTLLESVQSNPRVNLGLLNIIPQEEKDLLLKSFNDTESPLPDGKTILDLFEQQVGTNPDALAVEFEGNQLSYRQLDAQSNQLAHFLINNGLKPESPVPICIDRSLEMIIGIFGILKSGGAYVPIDPSFPKDRIDYMIEDTKANFVICSSQTASNFTDKAKLVIMDKEMGALFKTPSTRPPFLLLPENLAYIIYTSGSTGKPKGAMVNHRNLINFSISLTKIVGYDSSSRQLSVTTFIFDAFCLELFVPLINGGAVFLVKKEVSMDGFSLARKIAEVRPTHMQATPSGWQILLGSGWKNKEGIIMTTGGEALMEETKNLLAQTGTLWNLYGPTETTITSTFKKMEVGDKVTIGKPIDNTSVYILSADGSLNPVGIPGELCIGGDGVGRGYLNRPELTSQKFVPNPFGNIRGDKMYRTGDLARWLPDGNIEYLGRMDDQVKIRGYRIELGEIESVVLLYPGVKQSVVLARENGHGDKTLIGYVVCEGDFEKESAISFLKSKLPEYMVPKLWLQLEKLPINFSGKIDKKALPDVTGPDIQNSDYSPPKTDLENKLANIWKSVLGLERVGIRDDFFALGGHSLLAMKVIATIRHEIGLELSIGEMFNYPTISQQIDILEPRNNGKYGIIQLETTERHELIPLSYNQQSLWFIDQLSGSTQYHIPIVFRIEGDLSKKALHKALVEIVNRHEILRTVVSEKDGVVFQKILEKNLFETESKEVPKEELAEEIAGIVKSPFDLTSDHMIRAWLLRHRDETQTLVIILHHIAFDGASTSIFKTELWENYKAFSKGSSPNLPSPKHQYVDYAVWQRRIIGSSSYQSKLEHWKNSLKGTTPIQVPTDFIRPAVISSKGDTVRFTIGQELINNVYAIGQRQNATLFMTLLTAFKVLLHRYSQQEDICVGTPVSGREMQEFEEMIGFFVNSIPIRTQLAGNVSFNDLLNKVRSKTIDSFDNGQIPFELIVESLEIKRDLSRNPLFQVLFVLHGESENSFQTENTKWTSINYNQSTSRFDFAFELTETRKGLDGMVEFSTDLFAKETIERMVDHYKTLLVSITENPTERIDKLKMMGSEEENLILKQFNNTKSDYPKNETVVSLFEKTAKQFPNSLAVVAGGQSINYNELNQRANKFANYLILKGVKSENPVPLCVDRSIDMVIGILGILKVGGALVPVDPSLPVERIDYMLEDTGADFVICNSSTSYKVANHKKLIFDQECEEINSMSSINPLTSPNPENLFDIIYTSGSTGKPKGVMVEHRNLVNFLFSMTKDVDFNPSSSVLSVTTYSFDIFYLELFLPLYQGGCVFLADKETSLDGYRLAKEIEEKAPSHMQATPSGWQVLLESGWNNPTGLKMLVGGEALKEETKNALSSLGTLWNLYGPTETTIWSTFNKMESSKKVNIGKPIANTSIYIFGSGDQPNPIGIPGELCIGGDGVGRGYLNRPELTSEKFVPDPFSGNKNARFYRTGDLAKWLPDGNIEYLGRIDDQVKIRGHRIELGEIETVLQQHEGIKQAVVAVKQDNFGINRLIGYVICRHPFDKDGVISFLKGKLPDYMVPNIWMELDAFPLTFNGKINRKALPEPATEFIETTKYEAPKTELQKKVSGIWRRILGVEKVGLNDDFFELGGHSLMAMRAVAALRQETGLLLSISDLFANPTLKMMTDILAAKDIGDGNFRITVPDERPEILPLSHNQLSIWFIHQLEGSIQYHIPIIFDIRGKIDTRSLDNALVEIVNRHEILRTVISERDGIAYQRILKKNQFQLDKKAANKKELDQEITRLIRMPFHLEKDHMIRACLITLGTDEYCLVITMHHIASDGWSASILKRELKELYRAFSKGFRPDLPELTHQYSDYALWQRNIIAKDAFKAKLEYWKQRLQDTTPLQLPTDFTRPSVLSTNGDIHRFSIDAELVLQLKNLAKNQKATLFMTLLAAYKVLLYRYSGQEDICVGTPIAGRENKETEDLIGFFVNTLALRTEVKNSLGFADILTQVKTSTLEAFEAQEVPFEMIVGELGQERDLSRNPIFQVLFVLQNVPDSKFEIAGAEVSEKGFEHFTSKFDMTFELTETKDGMQGVLEFCTDLFKKETVTSFVSHYMKLLRAICDNPTEKIGSLNILQDHEERQILESFNKTQKPIQENITILDLFESQVQKNPEVVAVAFEGTKLSYFDLDKKSNQLASYLITKGIKNEELIPICLDRSLEMIIGILGILKAGGAYVPIDPTYPEDRINFMLDDSNAKIVLTTSDLIEKFSNSLEIICLDTIEIESEIESDDLNDRAISQNNLAYVIYTSGSTGKPKGVLIEHRGLVASTLARHSYYGNTGSVLLIPSFAFDSSVAVIFGALTTGSQLILCKSEFIKSSHHIQKLLKDTETLLCVPSYYRFLQEEELLSDSKLVNVILAGENLDQSLVKLHFDKTKKVKLFNEYGPTEGTVWASVAQIHSPEEKVTIGKPIDHTRIFIVNKDNQLNPVNVPGELCISGKGVARGYLNNPELTMEKFVKNPFSLSGEEKMYRTGDLASWLPDGNIEYLGRIDDQVKIRGYRIELGEIEQALYSHVKVDQCVVIARSLGKRKDLELIAYTTGEAAAEELRSYLKEKLPNYMVPSHFVKLASLPLTSNGKVNRKSLPDPDDSGMQGVEYTAPITDEERFLAKKWSEVLRVKESGIGLATDFFALGGDSIKAIQIVARLRTGGYELKISDVMISSKLVDMASKLRTLTRVIDQAPVEGEVMLSPIQCGFLENSFAKGTEEIKDYFHQSFMFCLPGGVTELEVRAVMEKIVAHHDALRMRYEKSKEGVWKQYNNGLSGDYYIFEEATLPNDREDFKSSQSRFFEEHGTRLKQRVSFRKGPLLGVGLYHDVENNESHLLLCIHHMVIDLVSWRILFEDIDILLNQYRNGEDLALPEKTDSYRYWMERNADYANGHLVERQRPFWDQRIKRKVDKIAAENPEGRNLFGVSKRVGFTLSREQTAQVYQGMNGLNKVEINTLLLAALSRALKDMFGTKVVKVLLEGHGREGYLENTDISRTVGWFTSIYPFVLITGDESVESVLMLQDALNKVPDKGVGYGILRYLHEHRLPELEDADVSFNFFGDFSKLAGKEENETIAPPSSNSRNSTKKILNYSKYEHGADVHPDLERETELEVSGQSQDGCLEMSIQYSSERMSEELMQSVAVSYKTHLLKISESLSTYDKTVQLPSGFTYKGLTMQQVEKLTQEYGTIEDVYQLSPMQQGIYFHALSEPDSQAYFIQIAYGLSGFLDIDKLKDAFSKTIKRHAVLRTIFRRDLGDDPLQVVLKDNNIDFRYQDIREKEKTVQKEYLKQAKETDIVEGFDLSVGPLVRLTVLQLSEDTFFQIWSTHHLIIDGWSTNRVLYEFDQYYKSSIGNKQIILNAPEPFSHYIAWLDHVDRETSISYWKNYLSGYETKAFLPFDSNGMSTETRYLASDYEFWLDKELTEKLTDLASKEKTTLNTIIQSAWGVLLSRYNNTQDVVFGSVVSGRPSQLKDIQEMIGIFINTVPQRVSYSGQTTFKDLLQSVHQSFIAGESHHYLSLAEIQHLSDLGSNLIDQLLIFENYPISGQTEDDNTPPQSKNKEEVKIISETIQLFEQMTYDFTLMAALEDRLFFRMKYNGAKYSEGLIKRLERQWKQLLKEISNDTTIPITHLNILPLEEKTHLLESLNGSKVLSPLVKTIVELIQEQVDKTPEDIALKYDGTALTYRELNETSNQLAHYLLSLYDIKPDVLVGIELERNEWMVISILAIIKAGAAYVPIDPNYPLARKEFIKQDSGILFCLNIDTLLDFKKEWKDCVKSNPTASITADNLVYCIYTSGSTGNPKAVTIEHKQLSSYVMFNKEYFFKSIGNSKHTNWYAVTNYTFDISVFELLGSLAMGFTINLNPIGNTEYLLSSIVDNPHGVLQITPSYFEELILDEKAKTILPSLGVLLIGGEAMGEKVFSFIKDYLPQNTVFNVYGPTEATIWSTAFLLTGAKKVLLGKPLGNESIYILNHDLNLVPIGSIGEICIGGVGLARGYLNRPDLTREKFIENPFKPGERIYRTGDLGRLREDGNLEYLGRIDDQIKIRGHRIELGEIEKALARHPKSGQCVVIARALRNTKDKELIAYTTGEATAKDLKNHIKDLLPSYMVPNYFVSLTSIPLTSNGKIDRKALPTVENKEIVTSSYVEPKKELEKQIAALWQRILGLERVSIEDDFFEIGGHSILAVKVISAMEKEFGLKLSINLIFKYPSISSLAKAIENSHENQKSWNSLVPIKPSGTKPPLFIIHGVGSTVSIYYTLAKYIDNDQPIFGFQPKGMDGIEIPNNSVEEMAAYYISLMIKQYPSGPYCIAGYSFGGYVAYEMARQLKAMGREVSKLILFDTSAYEDEAKLSWLKKLKLQLGKRIVNLGFAFQEPEGFYEQKRRSFERKKDQVLIKLNLKARPETQKDQGSIIKVLASNNVRILKNYKLANYAGDLYLFKAKHRPFYVEDTKYYGWGPLVERIHIVNVSGHHDNIFKKPEILKEMASKIQMVLDEPIGK